LPDQKSFSQELICTKQRDHGFLALFGYNRDFDFSLFDIEHCVCDIALRKDDFVLPMRGNAAVLRRSFKKDLRIEPWLCRSPGDPFRRVISVCFELAA
jgi:hypothetical protein